MIMLTETNTLMTIIVTISKLEADKLVPKEGNPSIETINIIKAFF